MKYKSVSEMQAHGFSGKCWFISVVVFNAYEEEDGSYTTDCVYWDDGTNTHPFECVFDDYDEAKAYAATFDADMVAWAHTHGNGPGWQHVSVDVVETEFDGEDLSEGDTRCMFEWWDARELQVIEFDESGRQIKP